MSVTIEDSALCCPSCGERYLHHDRVAVYQRDSEDSKTGLSVSVANGRVSTGRSQAGNPSSRRGGIAIRFWCEHCKVISILAIHQHKGNTFIEWLHDVKYQRYLRRERIRELKRELKKKGRKVD